MKFKRSPGTSSESIGIQNVREKSSTDGAEIAIREVRDVSNRRTFDQTHRTLKVCIPLMQNVLEHLDRRACVEQAHSTHWNRWYVVYLFSNRIIPDIGLAGTIGTALFVQIGSSLTKGGPGSLFVAFTLWSTFVLAVNNCLCMKPELISMSLALKYHVLQLKWLLGSRSHHPLCVSRAHRPSTPLIYHTFFRFDLPTTLLTLP